MLNLYKKLNKALARTYSISNWYGRLGNNIQQVANCLMLSEARGYTFEQDLDHEIIDKCKYNFGKNGLRYTARFFSWEPCVNCANNSILVGSNEIGLSRNYIYSNMRRVCREYVNPILKIPTFDPFDDNTLVIHIRAGDAFDREFTKPNNYVQNPLSYYLYLIDKFNEVIVVVEPNCNNPVVTALRKIQKLRFQSCSVAEDFATLLAARNLASSGIGTFAMAAALCSQNLKNYFTSDLFLTEHLNYKILYDTDVNVHEIKLPNYIPVFPCSWKNNQEQRKLMMDYVLKTN